MIFKVIVVKINKFIMVVCGHEYPQFVCIIECWILVQAVASGFLLSPTSQLVSVISMLRWNVRVNLSLRYCLFGVWSFVTSYLSLKGVLKLTLTLTPKNIGL